MIRLQSLLLVLVVFLHLLLVACKQRTTSGLVFHSEIWETVAWIQEKPCSDGNADDVNDVSGPFVRHHDR